MKKLMGDQDHISQNLYSYINGFSPAVRDVFERFEFHTQIERLAKAGLLYQVTERFTQVDLHPDQVSNHQMGLVFEELIRKFAELSNETAGEHFTPREVIRLMVNLIFIEDDDVLSKPGVVRTIYDPTAGTGGMLSIAGEYLEEHNPKARLTVFGQELNPESYAICKADMLIKGQDVSKIVFGNTLSEDGHPATTFDYMLSNPPFGVEWKKVEKEVRKEHETLGYNGRFGPGLPRVPEELEPIPSLGIAAGDLLISRANTKELVGGAAVAHADYPRLMLSDKLYRLRLDETASLPDFVAFFLGTGLARGQIELAATGASSSMQNIGQGTILGMAAPLPPVPEQSVIVAFLNDQTAKFDALTAEAQRAIELLKEHRSALISAAITGKIDVRGLVSSQEAA